MDVDFRELIRLRMRDVGLRQADLARRAGVHPVSMSRFLGGKSAMDQPTIERVLAALGGGAWRWGRFARTDEPARAHAPKGVAAHESARAAS